MNLIEKMMHGSRKMDILRKILNRGRDNYKWYWHDKGTCNENFEMYIPKGDGTEYTLSLSGDRLNVISVWIEEYKEIWTCIFEYDFNTKKGGFIGS